MFRKWFCIILAGVWTAVMFPVVVLVMALTFNRSTSMYWVKYAWAPVLLWGGGAKLRVTGADKLPKNVPLIFVANHQSTIDIPAIFTTIPGDFRAVAKKSLRNVPFLGWYLWLAGFVLIDRGNRREAMASLDLAAERIRNGTSVLIFAEGTRSEDGRMLPFKKGPFALAMKAGVPICPVVIEGSGKLMPKNSWNITPGPIDVAYGDLIHPAMFGEDRAALIRHVRDQMITMSLGLGGKGGDRDQAVEPAVSGMAVPAGAARTPGGVDAV